ncbi:MAG: VWA domain-containing protein [Candidatus Thermoplasmatota archaeon]|nr:VWA domain-containing protein [Candidatus Thermoplasmatota archaeon]
MAQRAERLSLLFAPSDVHHLDQGFAEALAAHLVGLEVATGDHLHLPGWPPARIDEVVPAGSTVGPGTRVEVHLPPELQEGALSLVVLVDASLTMGKGGAESPFRHAAQLLDALLLNARSFLARAGIVVQGGTTRHVEPLADPTDLTGASILKVTPQGTFDLAAGIQRAVDLLANGPSGPKAIVVLTDGEDAPKDHLPVVRPALHAGAVVLAHAPKTSERLNTLCQESGGRASTDPEEVFDHLTTLAGTDATWVPPATEPTRSGKEEPHEFEVVIETLEP